MHVEFQETLLKEVESKLKQFFLEKEDDDSEMALLESLNEELSAIKPLGVIGYGLRQYDIPLLVMKKQHYNLLLWKLVDMTESAVHIDLYHLLKYKGYKNWMMSYHPMNLPACHLSVHIIFFLKIE